MEQDIAKTRNPIGLFLVGLLLGPIASMLWLGKLMNAMVYFAAEALLITGIISATLVGFINPIVIDDLGSFGIFHLSTAAIFVIGLFHAFRLNQTPALHPTYSRWYFALTLPLLLPFALWILFRTFLFQPFHIPTLSSHPSLMAGDYVWVSKISYSKNIGPKRGDLAVFKLPRDITIDYVKRIVGLPGDRIKMTAGVLSINGVNATQEKVTLAPNFYNIGNEQYYRETLPDGRSYIITNLVDDSPVDSTDEYLVPDGHYFSLGDNRDNSIDSRFLEKVGYIPISNFTGRVVSRFWNSQGLSLINRPTEGYPHP